MTWTRRRLLIVKYVNTYNVKIIAYGTKDVGSVYTLQNPIARTAIERG